MSTLHMAIIDGDFLAGFIDWKLIRESFSVQTYHLIKKIKIDIQ
jgi:hypothetical protein